VEGSEGEPGKPGVFPIRYGRGKQELRGGSVQAPGHALRAREITEAVSFSGAGLLPNSHLAFIEPVRHEFLLTGEFDQSAAATQLAFSPAEVVS
jgi:hypothetical protein